MLNTPHCLARFVKLLVQVKLFRLFLKAQTCSTLENSLHCCTKLKMYSVQHLETVS